MYVNSPNKTTTKKKNTQHFVYTNALPCINAYPYTQENKGKKIFI